jgi:hypothetical protein
MARNNFDRTRVERIRSMRSVVHHTLHCNITGETNVQPSSSSLERSKKVFAHLVGLTTPQRRPLRAHKCAAKRKWTTFLPSSRAPGPQATVWQRRARARHWPQTLSQWRGSTNNAYGDHALIEFMVRDYPPQKQRILVPTPAELSVHPRVHLYRCHR